jgi:DNA-binding GntR family transcriptional regulator
LTIGKSEKAYKLIKNRIIQWEYPPLRDLSEKELQKELGVSRTPIREAFLRLEKEGFIYIYPRKGTIVTEITHDLIEMIYQVRELNEPAITAEASHFIDKNWLKQMKNKFLNLPNDTSEKEQRKYLIKLDLELHSYILENSRCKFLKLMMENIFDHNHRIRLKVSNPKERYDQSLNEHIKMIDAMISEDDELIKKVTLEHIRGSKKVTYISFNSKNSNVMLD